MGRPLVPMLSNATARHLFFAVAKGALQVFVAQPPRVDAKIKEINEEGAVIEKESGDNSGAPETVLLPADTVILAVGAAANNEIYAQLQEKVEKLYLIGDAAGPRKLTEAIREGFDLGRQLE